MATIDGSRIKTLIVACDADRVFTHVRLAHHTRHTVPGVPVVPFQLFLGDPAVARIVSIIHNGETFEA